MQHKDEKWDSLQDSRRSHGGRGAGEPLTGTANAVDVTGATGNHEKRREAHGR